MMAVSSGKVKEPAFAEKITKDTEDREELEKRESMVQVKKMGKFKTVRVNHH